MSGPSHPRPATSRRTPRTRCRQAGFSPLLARLFAARGVLFRDELDPDLKHLLPPEGPLGMLGIDKAAVLLADAIWPG